MNIINKIILGALGVVIVGLGGYFVLDKINNPKQNNSLDTPENIASDYEDLLAEAEQIKITNAGCGDKHGLAKQIKSLEDQLSDLADRKKDWLDNVPKLPEVEPELLEPENPLGSEVPELSSDVPPLPEIDPESIIVLPGRPGSEVPELTPDVPPLPEVDVVVVDDSGTPIEYIPELPELNTGRPGSEVPELTSDVPPLPEIEVEVLGSEVPELTSDVPPLPEIDEMNIIDPNEYIFQMQDYESKIKNLLQELKTMCPEGENKKIISDKCEDACVRHKKCASFTEDVTPTDLNDAYIACIEECITWPKEMVKCINTLDIKVPNDCVSFVQCQLPQLYEERYK